METMDSPVLTDDWAGSADAPVDLWPATPQVPVSVDDEGNRLDTGIRGVEAKILSPNVDHRGYLAQIIDMTDPFWREPVVYSYCLSVRPGRIKGWGAHKRQVDRHFIAAGNARVVLCDGREGSPTFQRFSEFHFTDESRGLLRIPNGVWHAVQNWGTTDVLVMNFPTVPYNHADPDKFTLDPHSGPIEFDWDLRDSSQMRLTGYGRDDA